MRTRSAKDVGGSRPGFIRKRSQDAKELGRRHWPVGYIPVHMNDWHMPLQQSVSAMHGSFCATHETTAEPALPAANADRAGNILMTGTMYAAFFPTPPRNARREGVSDAPTKSDVSAHLSAKPRTDSACARSCPLIVTSTREKRLPDSFPCGPRSRLCDVQKAVAGRWTS